MRKYLLFVAIIILAILLRFHNYAVYPQRGATSDEYAYAFLGTSLLTNHEPISWSLIRSYDWTDVSIQGINFPIVKPFFDAPPLFGLIIGIWSALFGYWTMFDVNLSVIRLVPILLSLVSGAILYMLAQKLYDQRIAVGALLIYSISTIMVINQRIVVTESLLTVLMLLILLVPPRKIIVLGLLSALAFLTKLPGIFLVSFVLYRLLLQRVSLREIVVYLSVASTGIIAFIVYGVYFDADLFWMIVADQGNRPVGPMAVWNLLTNPMIVNKPFVDGWYVFGLLSLFFLFSEWKKHTNILVAAISYLFILLLSITQDDVHGWYLLPLFPLLALSASIVFQKFKETATMASLIFTMGVGLPMIKYAYESQFGLTPFVFRLLVLLLVVPLIAAIFMRKTKWYRIVLNAQWFLFLILSALLTWNYTHPG